MKHDELLGALRRSKMLRKVLPAILVSAITMVLTTVLQPLSVVQSFARSQPALAQPTDYQTCHTFAQTGFEVCGRFLAYWYKYGGLQVFGYPVSHPLKEISAADGKEYLVQYFERAAFELHPQNKPPYDVLLSQLGREKYGRLYPRGTSGLGEEGVVKDPQPEMNTSKQLRPGIYVKLVRDSHAAITGLSTHNCGLEMTWVLQVENRSNAPFVSSLDTANLTMLDSTGKSYPPNSECRGVSTAPYSGSFGLPRRLAPGEVQRGRIAFRIRDIPLSASHFQLKVTFSGVPIEFRYMLP
jgi:hypothetical protein